MISLQSSGHIVVNNRTLTATIMLLCAAGLPAAPSAHAYALEGQKWPTATTSFAYRIPGRALVFSTAMKQALAEWNTATPFKYKPLNRAAAPCNLKAVNGAEFAQTGCGNEAFGSSTLAVTFTEFSGKTFVHAGTVFNAHKTFSVYSGPLKAASFDFRRVAVHELGHALGLAHETKAGVKAIMQPVVSNIEKPQPDDIAGVRALY
jgi:predicted Zn-dependent protease